ncbi:unnamed protein product [Meloidogyne enterolobii]|uniref:Uncharacterized protein n=1 Tax=Meloidogyne enterolobii TaxID=390850 RepID=A0ACB0YSS5_MELEN
MDRLEVGELVLVPASGNSLKFERVEMFYHRKPDANVREEGGGGFNFLI